MKHTRELRMLPGALRLALTVALAIVSAACGSNPAPTKPTNAAASAAVMGDAGGFGGVGVSAGGASGGSASVGGAGGSNPAPGGSTPVANPIVINGTVTDASSGLGIGGAFVRLIVDGQVGPEASVDPHGAFMLKIAGTPGSVVIVARADGYAPVQRSIDLGAGRTQSVSISLQRAQ